MQESSERNYNPNAILDLDTDILSVECLEKLGLDENPFIDHARDPFLFIDQKLEMSVNVLVDYLQNQNSTLALLGEIGVGKTTLLRILLRKGYQHFNFCTLRAKPSTTYTQVEEKIKERWRLPLDEDNENIDTDEYVTKFIETGKNPVIIIDDAHRIRIHELDALLQLKHRVGLQSSQALGLVLAAEPSIQPKLTELEQTNPAATHIYQINARPFDAKQCEQYINYRLNKAGADDINLFSQEQIQEFYVKAQGLPRVINSLARDALTKRCQQQLGSDTSSHGFSFTPGMRLGVILAVLFGLAILAGVMLNQPKEETIELDLNKPEKSEMETQADSKPVKAEDISTTKPEAEEPSVTKKDIATINETKQTKVKPYVAPLVLGPLQIEDPASTDKQAKKVIEETLPFSPDWLLKQNPNFYTVQIVASPSQENLLAFTKKNFVDQQTAYYIKANAEKRWYILVYGIFETRDEALTAIEKLSTDIKKNQPYALQIEKIHQVIQQ